LSLSLTSTSGTATTWPIRGSRSPPHLTKGLFRQLTSTHSRRREGGD
jgi:hypothetical protein